MSAFQYVSYWDVVLAAQVLELQVDDTFTLVQVLGTDELLVEGLVTLLEGGKLSSEGSDLFGRGKYHVEGKAPPLPYWGGEGTNAGITHFLSPCGESGRRSSTLPKRL